MSRTPRFPPRSRLDRAISYISPERGLRRLAAKAGIERYDAAAGSYIGGRRDRRQTQNWNTVSASPDATDLHDLPTIRDRSRDLYRNNSLATGAINQHAVSIVGTGLTLKPQIDFRFLGLSPERAKSWEEDARRIYNAFCEHSDLADECKMYQQQWLVLLGVLAGGDIFANMVHAKGPLTGLLSLKIQLIEAELVSNPDRKPDTATLAGGIERDASTNRPIRAWIQDSYEHDHRLGHNLVKWNSRPFYNTRTKDRILLHVKSQSRPGQTRGVPMLAPVIEDLKQLGDYREAELFAVVLNACFAVVSKTETGEGLPETGELTSNPTNDLSRVQATLEAGTILEGFRPGESIESFASDRPNAQFESFYNAVVAQIAVGTDLTFEVLTRKFESSYSASKAALLEAWKFFRRWRAVVAREFCQPTYEAVIGESIERGYLAAPGWDDPLMRYAWLQSMWVGPSPGSTEPFKENKADEIAQKHGWKTAEEITMEKTGGDWEAKHVQRTKEVQMRRDDGLEALEEPDGGEPVNDDGANNAEPDDADNADLPPKRRDE